MGVQNVSVLSLETGTDGNGVLRPESKVLQQMWFAVLRYECPRESWMKFLEAHKAQGLLAEGIYKNQHAKPASYCPAWPGENTKNQPSASQGHRDTASPP